MKRSIRHLPIEKQAELCKVIGRITEFFPVEMIILFGSYAQGDYRDHTLEVEGYPIEIKSHYDLLFVFGEKIIHQKRMRKRVRYDLRKKADIITDCNIFICDIEELNSEIKNGSYFYTDIRNEGIRVYNSGKFSLTKPKKLCPKNRIDKAKLYFNKFFESGSDFLATFKFDFNRGKYSKAAFELHQAAESFYNSIITIRTIHRLRTHDLEALRIHSIRCDPRMIEVFPFVDDEEITRFNILKQAYISARYKMQFDVTKEDLNFLWKRVQLLKSLSNQSGMEFIQRLSQLT